MPRLAAAVGCLFPLLTNAALAQAHPEFHVGRNAAGKLVVKLDLAKPYPLQASVFPGIDGYAGAIPGVSSIAEANAAEGLYPPDPKSNLVLVLEHLDKGCAVWNDEGTGAMRIGDTFLLGNPFFDTHPIWILGGAEGGAPRTIRFRVKDLTGIHAESDLAAPRFIADEGKTQYMCPMRCAGGPVLEKPGKCVTCGMSVKLLTGRAYTVKIAPEGEGAAEARIRAGVPAKLRFQFASPDGKAVREFETVHEKLLHLLIVSADLAWFAHEHPEIQEDGSFLLTMSFPHGGLFTLYNDFTPPGVGMQVVRADLRVEGDAPPESRPSVDKARVKLVDGYTVELSAPIPIRSHQMQSLTFRISKGGVPVADLEPFLGAMGHMIVVKEDRTQFVHSHPLEPASSDSARRGGPAIVFSALFPVPGLYKAWGQFQHRGRVLTAPFVFEVVSPRVPVPAPEAKK